MTYSTGFAAPGARIALHPTLHEDREATAEVAALRKKGDYAGALRICQGKVDHWQRQDDAAFDHHDTHFFTHISGPALNHWSVLHDEIRRERDDTE